MGVIRGKATEKQKKSRKIYILRDFGVTATAATAAVIRCNMRITSVLQHDLCS